DPGSQHSQALSSSLSTSERYIANSLPSRSPAASDRDRGPGGSQRATASRTLRRHYRPVAPVGRTSPSTNTRGRTMSEQDLAEPAAPEEPGPGPRPRKRFRKLKITALVLVVVLAVAA